MSLWKDALAGLTKCINPTNQADAGTQPEPTATKSEDIHLEKKCTSTMTATTSEQVSTAGVPLSIEEAEEDQVIVPDKVNNLLAAKKPKTRKVNKGVPSKMCPKCAYKKRSTAGVKVVVADAPFGMY